ncbi:MAG: hypothetical protein OXC61_03850 [Flavobacteriaceae bacterium]|nr:hypothetical protein [Flavobacteriaceae bacterium]
MNQSTLWMLSIALILLSIVISIFTNIGLFILFLPLGLLFFKRKKSN